MPCFLASSFLERTLVLAIICLFFIQAHFQSDLADEFLERLILSLQLGYFQDGRRSGDPSGNPLVNGSGLKTVFRSNLRYGQSFFLDSFYYLVFNIFTNRRVSFGHTIFLLSYPLYHVDTVP